MKIMSFNTQHCLNYLTRKIDFEIMAKTILDEGADIVGLNEMRGIGVDPEYTAQTEELARLTKMEHYFFAPAINPENEGLYGNAFLSKIPILNAEIVMIPDPNPRRFVHCYETRCILKAQLEGGITVLVTHFGLNSDEQENAVKTVLEHIKPEKCILLGDFNVEPDSKLLTPIREKMVDTAKFFDEPKLSFPSDNPQIKIDYIFVSPDIEVVSADIPFIVASDHRPHTANVKI